MSDEPNIENDENIQITPTVWPLDTSALVKGSTISVNELEQITGRTRGTSAFQLDTIQIVSYIRSQLWARGLHAVVCTQKGAIRVLTDSEALDYNQKLHDQGLRRAQRGHLYQSHVDVTGLSKEEVDELDRSLNIMGATIVAMATARRQARRMIASPREDRPAIASNP